MQKRHCLRIAWACIENKRLTSQQQQFRRLLKKKQKMRLETSRLRLLIILRLFFVLNQTIKQLPGINNAEFVQEKWSQLSVYF